MKVNERAYQHARQLIAEGHVVVDDRGDWSAHQPTAAEENRFIEAHGIEEYARWHLGIYEEKPASSKGRYRFPYGDFQDVHRCALLAAESRSGQYKRYDIERAVAHLHGMLEATAESPVRGR